MSDQLESDIGSGALMMTLDLGNTSKKSSEKEFALDDAPLRSAFGLSFDNPSAVSLCTGDGEPTFRHNLESFTPETFSDPSLQPRSLGSKCLGLWDQNRGVFLVVISQLFAALMNVGARLLETEANGHGMHTLQILFIRMTITTVLSSAYMWWANFEHFPLGGKDVRTLLIFRGFGGFLGVFGLYYSLRYLPIAESMVITFLAPTLACWVCAILLHEPFTRKEQIAGAIALIGVILIARPLSLFGNDTPSIPSHPIVVTGMPLLKFSNSTNQIPHLSTKRFLKPIATTPAQRLGAVGIALLGVLGAVISYVTIRIIGVRAHVLISVNYFSTCTALVSLLAILLLPSQIPFRLPSNSHEWFLLLFLGVCGFVQQLLFTKGLQCDEKSGSRATHMVYTHMIFALIFDRVFWGSIPPLASLLGGGMILGSAVWVAVVKTSGQQQQELGKDEEDGISLRLTPSERR